MAEALATKYRPNNFKDVIGQERSIIILQNQISSHKEKQGYLFCGAAGTGKTTIARIFASELKAELVEIDAASNNGVDNVRELRENVKFKAMGHSKKVYIIDEVHMLSTGAFNALLKTLEEPPSHVIFILCTTDPQKIPATILSRVQRFDFKRVPAEQIKQRLSYIVRQENITVEPEALKYLSKITGGGVRDSISLLDTCLSYSESLTLQQVIDILGVVEFDVFIKLWNSLALKYPSDIVSVVKTVYANGKDLKMFVRSFIDFVGDLEIIYLTDNWTLVEIPETYKKDIAGVNLVTFQKIVPKLFELHKLIQYDDRPKNLIIGGLVNLCD